LRSGQKLRFCLLRVDQLMSSADIEKWVSGETEVFFAPHAEGNLRRRRSSGRAWIERFRGAAIGAVLGTAATLTAVGFIIWMHPASAPDATAVVASRPPEVATTATRKSRAEDSDGTVTALPSPTNVAATLMRPTLNPSPPLLRGRLDTPVRAQAGGTKASASSVAGNLPRRQPVIIFPDQ
jgi:hypothetical protein